MLLIAVYYRRCGRNLRAKLYTAINSLSANYAYLKTLYKQGSVDSKFLSSRNPISLKMYRVYTYLRTVSLRQKCWSQSVELFPTCLLTDKDTSILTARLDRSCGLKIAGNRSQLPVRAEKKKGMYFCNACIYN